MTEDVVRKLEEAFQYWFTDEEACLHADISKPSLYEYCKLHPDFLTRKEVLKHKPNMIAKRNKVQAIKEGNLQESWRRLERKAKDEFSLRTENTWKDGEPLQVLTITDEQMRLIAEDCLRKSKSQW